MASEHLGPAHPCHGCVHRGHTLPYMDSRREFRRMRPGNDCNAARWQVPVFMGDDAPTWCPGKVTK